MPAVVGAAAATRRRLTEPPTEEATEADQSGTDRPGRRDLRRGQRGDRLGWRLRRRPQSQTEQTATLYTGMVSSLNELGTPKENPSEYTEFSGAAEQLAKVEGEVKLAAEREDAAALETAEQEAVPALENFQSTATVYGFEECGQEPSAPATAPSTGSEAEEGGVEAAPEIEEVAPEEAAPEEIVPGSRRRRRRQGRWKKWLLKKAAAARNPAAAGVGPG